MITFLCFILGLFLGTLAYHFLCYLWETPKLCAYCYNKRYYSVMDHTGIHIKPCKRCKPAYTDTTLPPKTQVQEGTLSRTWHNECPTPCTHCWHPFFLEDGKEFTTVEKCDKCGWARDLPAQQ